MENQQQEHYFGLNIDDCIKLYDIKRRAFMSEWEYPLESLLREKIINRIREIDGRTKQEMIQEEADHWEIDLPFYIPFEDDKGRREFYCFAENGVSCGSAVVTMARINPETEECERLTLRTLNDYRWLYRWLTKMGFWEESALRIFHMD